MSFQFGSRRRGHDDDDGYDAFVDNFFFGKKKPSSSPQNEMPKISDPNDAQEKQADQVAGQVAGGGTVSLNNMTASSSAIQTKSEGGSGAEATPEFTEKLNASKGGGESLPEDTRTQIEQQMGADFSGVKVHTDDGANSLSKEINAKAFTHGQDVYFGQGQYDPQSQGGKQLLAHELVHTKQQGEGANLIQRAVWEDNVYTYKNAVPLAAAGTAFGSTVMVINGVKNVDTKGDFFKHIDPGPHNTRWGVLQGTQTPAVMYTADYQIKSHAEMQILEKPIDDATGWRKPVKLEGIYAGVKTNHPSLASATSITGVVDDPNGNDKLYERVKLGEEQHANAYKELHERYFQLIETRMKELIGSGPTQQEAAKDLYTKVRTDKTITRLVDAFMHGFDSNAKMQYDDTPYALHNTKIDVDLSKDVDPVAKTMKFHLQHRYSQETMQDPIGTKIGPKNAQGEQVGYREKIAPSVTIFDPAKLKVDGTNIVDGENKLFKKFSSAENAQLGLDTINHFGFNQIESIGPFEIFSVNGTPASGTFSKIKSQQLESLYLNVWFDSPNSCWDLVQSMERDANNKVVQFKMLQFPNKQEGMRQAYSSYDAINTRNLYTFHWIGSSTEKPEMAFYGL